MAVKIGYPERRTAVREFTDRIEPRKAFWKRYREMCDNGTTLISYYGAGGVGKSSLLKKLMDEIDNRADHLLEKDEIDNRADHLLEKDEIDNRATHLREKVSYIHYDFDNDLNTRTTLQNFKSQLAKQGCEFPLFETGDFYYQFSIGNANETDVPKIQSFFDKSTWFRKVKSNWGKTFAIVDYIVPGANAAAVAISLIGEKLTEFWKDNQTFDEDHRDLKFRLNEAQISGNSNEIYKLLPELFARDVSDWLKQKEADKKKVLIVFLDTYEALVNETIVTGKQRSRDDWLKRDSVNPRGMIFLIPNTLWVIAGRNKLRWDNELADELDQHLITALSTEDSTYFLEKSGVESPTLREEIAALTQGFPIYLDLCVDVYERYKQRNHGLEPHISDFGESRQKVVERLIKYMDAPLQDMIKFLCALNYWTDEIAYELGRIALSNFSLTIYEQVKHFSFIQPDSFQFEDFSKNIFVFDKTVYGVLFAESNPVILKEIVECEKKYFAEKFKNIKDIDGEYIFHVNFCANLFTRLIDDSNELRKVFQEINFFTLIDWAKFDVAENVAKLFLEKTASLDNNDGVNFAYFERKLAEVKRAQGFFEEALELNESSLNIVLAKDDPDILDYKQDLAITLWKLGRYDKALKIQEEVLTLRKKFLGEKHPDIIKDMNNLAVILSDLKRYDEALNLNEKVLSLQKEIFGENHRNTITAMDNLAGTLEDLGRYDEALNIYEEVLAFRKNFLGEKHPDTITAMNNLAGTLIDLERYDEALNLQEKVLSLQKEILGEKHPDTITAMDNLAVIFEKLGRLDEAINLQEKVLALREEVLGENHPDGIITMNDVMSLFDDESDDEEALKFNEELLESFKEIFGENAPDTIDAMNTVSRILYKLNRNDEAKQMIAQALELSKNNLPEYNPIAIQSRELYEKICGNG